MSFLPFGLPFGLDSGRVSFAGLKSKSFLSSLEWVSRGAFRGSGYRWQLRQRGDLKLGCWKKTLRCKSPRQPYPKRLVLIPEMADSPLSWHPVLTLLTPLLKKHYDEVIVFDFPGFAGALCQEKAFPTLEMMMAMVGDVLDSLRPHTILGHSLGGWVAAYYTSLCGTGQRPALHSRNYQGPLRLLLVSPAGLLESEPVPEKWSTVLRASTQAGFSVLKPHLFARQPAWFQWVEPFYLQFLRRGDIADFIATLVGEQNLAVSARDIQAQVWLLWGEKNTLIPVSSAWEWMKRLHSEQENKPGAVLLRNLGHHPQSEKPSVTAAVIGQILTNRKPHRYGHRWWKVFSDSENGPEDRPEDR